MNTNNTIETVTDSMKSKTLEYKAKLGLGNSLMCTKAQNDELNETVKRGEKLPSNVVAYEFIEEINYYKFVIYNEDSSSIDQIEDYLKYKKLYDLQTIKKCMVYFTTLSVICLVGFLSLLVFALLFSV